LNETLLHEASEALQGKGSVTLEHKIQNTDRSVGASIAGAIGKKYLDEGLPPGSEIQLNFKGEAGQSFGVWTTKGMRLRLEGESNDYVGKGMSGGEIIVVPQKEVKFKPEENVIVGNTCFYGSTGGRAFIRGLAGERFGVRNSGGTLVVEGLGDHGCEYMTGGTVLVLGPTGRNFGAGMTGGEAFVLDEKRLFDRQYNPELIEIENIQDKAALEKLAELLKRHLEVTGSTVAGKILKNFGEYQKLFWHVKPKKQEANQENAAKVIPLKKENAQGN
ncbi:MAG: glutamate synthase subunit alpha, partial [Deltaproteobacteria bacterium]|nr:glutamate synthase subunit alpha [Deltaproteobacteria bacterium]